MRYYIGVTIAIIGLIFVGFAQLVGIGTVLYEWSNDIQVSTALWDGFIRWVGMSLIGGILTGIGLVIKEY